MYSSPAKSFFSVNCFCLHEMSVVCPMHTVMSISTSSSVCSKGSALQYIFTYLCNYPCKRVLCNMTQGLVLYFVSMHFHQYDNKIDRIHTWMQKYDWSIDRIYTRMQQKYDWSKATQAMQK